MRGRGVVSGAGDGTGVAKKSLSQHDDDDNNIKLSCRASAASSMHPQVIRPTSISIALSTPITVHEPRARYSLANYVCMYVLLPPQGVHKTAIICQRQRHLSPRHAPGWVPQRWGVNAATIWHAIVLRPQIFFVPKREINYFLLSPRLDGVLRWRVDANTHPPLAGNQLNLLDIIVNGKRVCLIIGTCGVDSCG